MNSKRNNDLDETIVHKNFNESDISKIKNQETILSNRNTNNNTTTTMAMNMNMNKNKSIIKDEMRKKGLQHTNVPKTRRSSRDRSLDFDPFLEETIYDEKYKNQKSNDTLKFVIITFIIAVIVCISVFAIAFKTFLDPQVSKPNDNINNITNENTINNKGDETIINDILEENIITITALVREFNFTDKKISVIDIRDKKTYSFIIDGTTKLYDQYGKVIVLAELNVGDVLDITFDSASIYAKEIKKNENSFIEKRVTGIEIDTVEKTIINGNKTYMYTNDIIVMDNSEVIDISSIDRMDTVTFSGYNDVVFKIEVLKGHGVISFTNIESIENGVVEIDTNILFRLSVETSSNVSVGEHNLVIKGDNIDTYTNKIFVDQNEEVIIDLSNLPNKKGLLNVKTNVSDPQVAIDGVIYTEAMLLPYGTYVVTVSAVDHLPESKSITINKEQQDIEINLTAIEKNARMIIDTTPTGAEVYMDDRLIGLTPIDENIEIGHHSFVIKLDGYDDKVFNFVAEEKPYSYIFVMTPKTDNQDNLIIP